MPRTALTREQRDRQRWEDEDREIVARIGAWMALTGKSLEELATLCGMSRSTMYNRKKAPSTLTLGEYRALKKIIGG